MKAELIWLGSFHHGPQKALAAWCCNSITMLGRRAQKHLNESFLRTGYAFMTLHAPDTAIATRLYAAWHFEMHLEQPAIQFKDAFSVHIIDFGIKKKNDLNQLSPGRMNDLQMWIFSRNDADYFSGMPRSVYFF